MRNFGKNMEFLVVFNLVLALLSTPLAIMILASVLHRGTTTEFSSSDSRVGWVEGPTSRGTMNIIWVCASTIYTCVYVSVHIDVMDTRRNADDLIKDLRKREFWPTRGPGKIFQTCFECVWKAAAHLIVRRAVWFVFNIVAPGLVILVAVLEVISAHDGMRFMRDRGQGDWNMSLAFFADMGGFARREEGEVVPFYNGLEFLEWFDEECSQKRRKFTEVQITDIKAEIDDRSDADYVLKLLTVSQAGWFFVETMVRFAEGRAVSQLEVVTCSYIFCTAIAYSCWACKPYHVTGRIILPEPADSNPSAGTQTGEAGSIAMPQRLFDKDVRFTPFNRAYLRPDTSWISKDISLSVKHILTCCNTLLVAAIASGVVGALVGVIHGAPLWEATFVNTHGQWLWRACSIVQFAFPLALTSSALIEQFYGGKLLFAAMALIAFFYSISQSILFVLVWISFWSLPESVYKDIDWSSAYFPHWH